MKVAAALFNAVEDWAGQRHGDADRPQGFTDLDPEGLLVEGYENPAVVTNR
jgi:hypothetical protein